MHEYPMSSLQNSLEVDIERISENIKKTNQNQIKMNIKK